MILVDTSAWIDHLRRRDDLLSAWLAAGVVLCHPFIIGELACGSLPEPDRILGRLADLPQAPVAPHADTLAFVIRQQLGGRGIGWIDMHLLASARLAGRATLYTHDKRLRAAA
ncbi:MAG TPA: type II toxin-antitoxin system VapC family toxin, partial [Salinisphaeraceae bacterium]|nr:type II toxin-antitoxin system VapC family toxin [Salinisphaeraceae bacterium]